jgi:hypothetical protein
MKLPFFFYNLNTLSSHAATTAAAAAACDTSFRMFPYSIPCVVPSYLITSDTFFFFFSLFFRARE